MNDSKPRYEILDGLRGVAALMVVMFHLFETYSKGPAYQIINHGYLAVDFFFVLSGFVVGYAYDDRWDRMSMWAFFKRRLIRLHPMVVMGVVVGALLFFPSACPVFSNVLTCEWWQFALCIVLGLLMIPCPNSLDIRGWGEMSSLNGPSWSLTFEYIANILYALVLRHLPTWLLAILMAGCAFFTLDLTLGWDVFGLFEEAKYNVIGGWSLNAQQMYVGFTRLLYPFLCGMVISRLLRKRQTAENPSGSPIRAKHGFLLTSLAIIVLLAMPCLGGRECALDGAYQAVCILLIFPLIVMTGAGTQPVSARGMKVCRWLGDISYPLYITHYPLMYLQMSWAWTHMDSAPMWMHVCVAVSMMIASVGMAWMLHKMYELPVRKWLTLRKPILATKE